MKDILLILLSLFLITSTVGCSDKINDAGSEEEIKMKEFSLEDFDCSWNRLSEDIIQQAEHIEMHIINNTTELLSYISCNDNIPEIDFEKYSLLLAKGLHPHVVYYEYSEFINDNDNYSWSIFLSDRTHSTITEYDISILVPKLNNSTVSLIVNHIN